VRIIIVDDDREFSDLLKKASWVAFYDKAKALARQQQQITEGLEIQQFDNQDKALEVIKNTSERIDLIFTEIQASNQARLDFIKTCHSAYHDRYGFLIIVAERGRQQDIDLGLAVGAEAYLEKPFTPEDLIKYISMAWEQD
jgi:two-component system chemotaxis response regulator CheY